MTDLDLTSLNRRKTLVLLGVTGISAVLGPVAEAFDCVTAPAQTEGPYFVEEKLNRSDIRVDPSNGAVSAGALMRLAVTVYKVTPTSCGVLPGAHVEVWHCDAGGVYSDVSGSAGRKFLRGYQISDSNGVV